MHIVVAAAQPGSWVLQVVSANGRPAGEPQPIDEAPGWELPTPTHAALTGEMPILTEDDLREDGDASTR